MTAYISSFIMVNGFLTSRSMNMHMLLRSRMPHRKLLCCTTEFVCPTLGFKEFLHSDWLNQILSWQKPIGCWGTTRSASQPTEKHMFVPVNNTGSSQQDVNIGLRPPVFRTRHLLYEKTVTGNHLRCCCINMKRPTKQNFC